MKSKKPKIIPQKPTFEWQKLYRICTLSEDGLVKFYNGNDYSNNYETELEAMRAVENELEYTGEWDSKTRNHLIILPFHNVKKKPHDSFKEL